MLQTTTVTTTNYDQSTFQHQYHCKKTKNGGLVFVGWRLSLTYSTSTSRWFRSELARSTSTVRTVRTVIIQKSMEDFDTRAMQSSDIDAKRSCCADSHEVGVWCQSKKTPKIRYSIRFVCPSFLPHTFCHRPRGRVRNNFHPPIPVLVLVLVIEPASGLG